MTEHIDISYSIYEKHFEFTVNGIKYDISYLVPDDVWEIGDGQFPTHPIKDWMIRKELRKIFIKFFKKNIDKNLSAKDVVF